MFDQAFVNSFFIKLEKYFFQEKLVAVVTIFDGAEGSAINNVIYLRMEKKYLGIYIRGSNPYFFPSFIDEVDAFNLHERYEKITTSSKMLKEFTVSSMRLIVNEDYNEVMGFYLSDEVKGDSFSMIFTYDELFVFESIDFNKYLGEVRNTLMHVERRAVFLTREPGNWEIISNDLAS